MNMSGADEWCTRTPHLEGEEVFVFLKQKQNTAFGSELESQRPDKISISRPCVQTRSTRNNNNSPPPMVVPDYPTATDEEELNIPTHKPTQQLERYHVTAVEETTCNLSEWHIARLQKTSAKACFAQQAITKKKCITRIVHDGKSPHLKGSSWSSSMRSPILR